MGSTRQATPEIGTALGDRYELTEQIGVGNFGFVFRARQLNVDRDVAVKVLPPKLSVMDEIVERFRREARLASQLRHPNTITVHDYGHHDDYFYIVMEYLTGEDLADRLAAVGSLPTDLAVDITKQTLRSLQEAHDHGIVHRDLKPENIFLTELGDKQNFVKLLDFGIAKIATHHPDAFDEDGRNLTVEGNTVGTPTYMSPEQAAGEEVDAVSDLYTVGVILYEMINGRPPFAEDRPVRTMRAHLFEEVPPFSNDELRNTNLESLVRRALAKESEDRFADAEQFLEQLQNTDLTARGVGALQLTPDGAEPVDEPDTVPFQAVPEEEDSPVDPTDSASNSIVTVVDEPTDDDVIVLTERKESSTSEDEEVERRPPSDPRDPTPPPSTSNDQTAASASDDDQHPIEESWEWHSDLDVASAGDTSSSQLLTDYESESARRRNVALTLAVLIIVVIAAVWAMGWFPA